MLELVQCSNKSTQNTQKQPPFVRAYCLYTKSSVSFAAKLDIYGHSPFSTIYFPIMCAVGCYIFGRLLIFNLSGRFFEWKSVKNHSCKIFFIFFNILKFHPSIEILGVLACPQKSKNRRNFIIIHARVKILVSKFSENPYSYLTS